MFLQENYFSSSKTWSGKHNWSLRKGSPSREYSSGREGAAEEGPWEESWGSHLGAESEVGEVAVTQNTAGPNWSPCNLEGYSCSLHSEWKPHLGAQHFCRGYPCRTATPPPWSGDSRAWDFSSQPHDPVLCKTEAKARNGVAPQGPTLAEVPLVPPALCFPCTPTLTCDPSGTITGSPPEGAEKERLRGVPAHQLLPASIGR